MNRLMNRMNENKQAGRKSLVCFLTAGDPSQDETFQLVLAAERAGCDTIELGIPFSDPMADGPVIQAANSRALANHVSLHDVLALVARIRQESQFPIVIMTYLNPVMSYGIESFAVDAEKAGVDGVILVDVPLGEAEEGLVLLNAHNICPVMLAAPTSTDERLEDICRQAKGFLYAVARMGVTGAYTDAPSELPLLMERIRKHTDMPVMAGFGISNPELAKSVAVYTDGVIVGSALVTVIAEASDRVGAATAFITAMRCALDEV